MNTGRDSFLATAIVVLVGALYGLYWLPVRALDGLGLPGAWGTLALTTAGLVLLLPWGLRPSVLRPGGGAPPARPDPLALGSVALGGGAFALYSIGFVYGEVALIILMWFLTPVWSTLIARIFLGTPITMTRMAAIFVGLCGLAIMLGAEGGVPLPRNLGEWMGLLGGMIWAVATTGIKSRPELRPSLAGVAFCAGAVVTSLSLAPLLAPVPDRATIGALWQISALVLASGALWWSLSMPALMWAAARIEPARVGILLMAEVLVGAATAALWAGETLSPVQIIGGGLVLVAAVLELWPSTRSHTQA